MPITASVLYDIVHCPQRVALDAFGDAARRDPPNPFVCLLWERGTLYEREVIDGLEQPFLDLSGYEDETRQDLTLEAMRRGEPLIYSGRIAAADLLGVPDLLRKDAGGYVLGDIKSGAGEEGGGDESEGKPKLHYAVQLALYVDILERLSLSAGRRAFVWGIHGDEVHYDFTAPQGPRTPETLWDEYQASLAAARRILDRIITPQTASSATCKNCHWHNFCSEQLKEADDLTLIAGLGRTVRDTMQVKIPTIAALAESNPEGFIEGKKTQFKGVGADRLRLFHS
jgi:predicted RecB family nuclease